MLHGDIAELPESLQRLSTTGLLSDVDPKRIIAWIDAATGSGLLRASDDVYRTLSLTESGRDVMSGRVRQVLMPPPEAPPPKAERKRSRSSRGKADTAVAEGPADETVLLALKTWRREEASRQSVPSYVVFHDKTLTLLAIQRPATRDALTRIAGLGPVKIERYGADLLAILAPSSR
jgi:ATP-dependent DNA helicase RecQ